MISLHSPPVPDKVPKILPSAAFTFPPSTPSTTQAPAAQVLPKISHHILTPQLHLTSTQGCSKRTHFLQYHKGPTLAREETTQDQRWHKTHTSQDPPIIYYAILGKQEKGQGQEIRGAAFRRALRLVLQGRIILLGGGRRLSGLG